MTGEITRQDAGLWGGIMALVDRPFYGDEGCGTFGRALAYRRTSIFGTVAKIPVVSVGPSAGQTEQRNLYKAALAAWRSLDDDARAWWQNNHPANLSAINFFIRLYLLPDLVYFGLCVFGVTAFPLCEAYHQPEAGDYDMLFPENEDEFPVLLDGVYCPEAWFFNRLYASISSVETWLIARRATIEGE